MVLEAITLKAMKEQNDAEETARREDWKKDHKGLRERLETQNG